MAKNTKKSATVAAPAFDMQAAFQAMFMPLMAGMVQQAMASVAKAPKEPAPVVKAEPVLTVAPEVAKWNDRSGKAHEETVLTWRLDGKYLQSMGKAKLARIMAAEKVVKAFLAGK